MNAIEIQALTKYYGKARGVIDISLAIQEGEFFGFIGPNGAGKIYYHPGASRSSDAHERKLLCVRP